jgi:hypothetical protein
VSSSITATTFARAARDLVSVISAREDFEDILEPFARRRAAAYTLGRSPLWEELYWVGLAQTLAAVGPADWMPMSAVLELGFTLEGGARGLRGLFTKEPSKSERKRVLKIATLAGRILEMIANADRALAPDETRLVAMAMNSFGLTPEELQQIRPGRALTFDDLEVFGELELKTRRALLRGAWQLAASCALDPARELAVRGVAARLEIQHEADLIRAEVLTGQLRQLERAQLAVELARSTARRLPPAHARAALVHLVDASAPALHRATLEELALSDSPSQLTSLPRMDSTRRRQAAAAAFATVISHDPSASTLLALRARMADDAAAAGFGSEAADAFDGVQRFLHERVRESLSVAEPADNATHGAEPPREGDPRADGPEAPVVSVTDEPEPR